VARRTPHVVAEIGCNHRGSFETAKEMIMIAAQFCKADVVKFQKRNPRECLTPDEYTAPHPNPMHSYGDTYGQHREFLEFDLDTHKKLKEVCESFNVVYSTSVWDTTSADDIIRLKPKLIKIPSACNTHFEMLTKLCYEYGGELHISLGMTSRKEEEDLMNFLTKKGRLDSVVMYHCTSGYPVPFEDLALLEIVRLVETYASKVRAIGFSGHHLGIAADVAAFTLGADWIERHFTLDRTWKGTDHAASLEPDGLRRVVRDLKAMSLALQTRDREILPIEEETRRKLKWDRAQNK
jgi:sialic acid synthase